MQARMNYLGVSGAFLENVEQVACENNKPGSFFGSDRNSPVAGRIFRMSDCAREQMHHRFTLGKNRRLIREQSSVRMKRLAHEWDAGGKILEALRALPELEWPNRKYLEHEDGLRLLREIVGSHAASGPARPRVEPTMAGPAQRLVRSSGTRRHHGLHVENAGVSIVRYLNSAFGPRNDFVHLGGGSG
jgi:hypothetical protein